MTAPAMPALPAIPLGDLHCNYAKQTGCTREQCRCELPSAATLPFFMYCGPGSVTPKAFDRFFCGCRGWD